MFVQENMLGAIAPYVSRIRRSYQSNDLIDRLSYQYTAIIVAISAFTLAATQYVGKPIQCWVPAQFTGAWEKYAETYCFIKGSYFVPSDEHPDEDFVVRDNKVLTYYQWVPLMLAAQAMLFYLPCLVWQILNTSSGINVKGVLEASAKVKKNLNFDQRRKQVESTVSHITEVLEIQRELKSETRFAIANLRKSGLYLTVLYICCKVLYILNVLAQFKIFNIFLQTDNYFWGWDTFLNIRMGIEWDQTGFFPRVTMCDFMVRVLGGLHRWTVQCVLQINMFTEKIYVFLWFWFVIVGLMSVISLIYWTISLCFRKSRYNFVTNYLRCTDAIKTARDENNIENFVDNYLTPDGVFLLRLIQTNGGDLLVSEIVVGMFKNYMRRYEHEEKEFDPESPDTTATLPR